MIERILQRRPSDKRTRRRSLDQFTMYRHSLSTWMVASFLLLLRLGARQPRTSTFAFVQPLVSRPQSRRVSTTLQGSSRQNVNQMDLRLLLIDHYDSFTYNLVDMLGQNCLHPPVVVAADSSLADVQRLLDQGTVDGIVLSPGPGNPDTCGSLAAALVETHPDTPILGVCLGHQIMGTVYGATCTQAPTPVHGQVQELRLLENVNGDDLWQRTFDNLRDFSNGVNGEFASDDESWQVTRYHSLHVTQLDQTRLIPTATSSDGQVNMAFRHATLPHYGVQFHPESVGSNNGWALLKAFCDICQQTKVSLSSQRHPSPMHSNRAHEDESNESDNGVKAPTDAANSVIDGADDTTVVVCKVPNSRMEPRHVMDKLLKDSAYRFWLDTADKRANAMSVLGQAAERVEYWGQDAAPDRRGVYVFETEDGDAQHYPDLDILTYLDREYSQPTNSVVFVDYDQRGRLVVRDTVRESANVLPFSYRGGHVGYLGYEVRHDTAEYLTTLEGGQYRPRKHTQKIPTSTPTAALMKAERSYVYHHDQKQWYLICHLPKHNFEHRRDTMEWIETQARIMVEYDPATEECETGHSSGPPPVAGPVRFTPNRSKETYNRNFETCLEKIKEGESYELCLTNKLEASVKTRETPLDLYSVLRRRNAAPFSSFFDWNSQQQVPAGSSFAICCSSPERFVSVVPGLGETMQVEAKPIKGTCARVLPPPTRSQRNEAEDREDMRRAEELRLSVKNRAENLMIVDLLRNDLSRVCRTGSVHAAKLMDIESFATVHQMVSTIRGTLDTPRQSAVSTLRACFPGGSMTGAPKLRTTDILAEIEEGVSRGPYSGCLGYVGVNGAMDMNIVIRTAVLTPLPQVGSWQVSVGAGGAITILSESEDEYEEMILKASAVIKAVEEWAGVASKVSFDPENKVQLDKTAS